MRKWENYTLINENTIEPHNVFFSYNNLELARTIQRENSQNFLLLNGIWNFNYYPNPYEVENTNFDKIFCTNKILVPSMWQLQGFGKLQYTDKRISFPSRLSLCTNQ